MYIYEHIYLPSKTSMRHFTQAYVEAMAGLQETVSKVSR